MKNLINRTFSESEREEIIEIAQIFHEDFGGSMFKQIRNSFIEKLNQKGLRNDKKAYTGKDAMFQSFSDNQNNFKKTGRF